MGKIRLFDSLPLQQGNRPLEPNICCLPKTSHSLDICLFISIFVSHCTSLHKAFFFHLCSLHGVHRQVNSQILKQTLPYFRTSLTCTFDPNSLTSFRNLLSTHPLDVLSISSPPRITFHFYTSLIHL
jgi:hypothetical protein